MQNDMESEKLSVIIFGQKFCSKLEHIPIKKRILLRDSAIYKQSPPSVEDLNQKIDSLPISPNSNHPGPPFLAKYSDLNSFSKQQADNLKSLQLNDNCMKTVAVNMEDSDSHPLFSVIRTPVDVIVNNAGKDRRTDALSPCTKGELRHVSSYAPIAKGDGLIVKGSGAVLSLTGNATADSYFGEKSALQPDYVSCKNLDAVQSRTLDNRILWDLNVEMDAWETPDNLLNAESQSDTTTSDLQNDSNLERSEEYRLKQETTMSESDTENNILPMLESTNSDGIDKHEQITSADGERYGVISEGQQVATGSCLGVACSIAKPSMEIASMNICCNHGLSSESDNRVTLKLGENTTNLFDCAPRRDPGTICATPNSSVVSTEEHSCEDKNIIIKGEGSVNILRISDNEDNNLSKRGTDSKAGQHDATLCSYADQLEQIEYSKESNAFATPDEKIIGETIKAAPSTRELTKTPPKHVHIDMGNPLLGSFLEVCDASVVQSDTRLQGDTVVKLIPILDKDCLAQPEQDYEDGELREVGMHCWNEDEIKIGKIEDIDNLDESQTSVSLDKGESGLKSRKTKLSETLVKDHLLRMDDVKMGLNDSGYGPHIVNTQLEKKLSGWDQLPKDRCSSSEKVHKTQGVLSRTLRSELHRCSDIPSHSEDAEDKETVVERRIRPKDMDASYPEYCGSGFDKFNGKRRSIPHMHGRNRVEDWDSERRSSVNYHDLYDNHSGSRLMNINSKEHEHEQCRSRSPYDRNGGYGPHISYSRGRNGSRAEEFGRSLRGARNVYRGSLADDQAESEFCIRPQFRRRDRRFSPRPAAHFSETLIRSRSRSRTRSPPLWVPPYERSGPRVHSRSPDDRVKRTRLQFWKSNYPQDSEMRYNSPTRSGYLWQNKSRWNDEEDFDLRVSRDRSRAKSFGHKQNFDASCSQGSFKSSEDFRPTGYRGRMRELTPPDRVRGYNGGKDRRKQGDKL